jgi:hypothetical protein
MVLVYSLYDLASVILEIKELLVRSVRPTDQTTSHLWNRSNDLRDDKFVLLYGHESAHLSKIVWQKFRLRYWGNPPLTVLYIHYVLIIEVCLEDRRGGRLDVLWGAIGLEAVFLAVTIYQIHLYRAFSGRLCLKSFLLVP